MDRVKADILSFMADASADVGHSFAERQFYFQRAQRYTPPEQDAIGSALDSLVGEGLLEKRASGYFLTDKGFARIYPGGEVQAIDEVKADILDSFRSSNARVGHALAVRPFHARYAMHSTTPPPNPRLPPPRRNALQLFNDIALRCTGCAFPP